jgi:hypothetical protein
MPRGVGHFHPLDGVDVNAKIPGIDLIRVDAGQQGEVARDHEPLDVVGVSVLQGLADRCRQAGHAGFGGPIEIGQRKIVPEKIHPRETRHQGPVDAPHVLAPAQNLPHEAFNLLNGDPLRVLFPGIHRRAMTSSGCRILVFSANDGRL